MVESSSDANWTKKTWDLPPYKSKEFLQIVPPQALPAFRNSPAYQGAVDAGLILDDEWVGDYASPT